jgi:hypothetical protein
MKKKGFIILVLSVAVLYLFGKLAFQQLYKLTIFSVKSLSNVSINFYGKYPGEGNTKFALILACVAPIIFLVSKILTKFKKQFRIAFFIYIFFFIISYVFYCWFVGFGLEASNDLYKSGDKLSYNLSAVNMTEVFGLSISLATLITATTLLLLNSLKKRQYKTLAPKTTENT